MIKRVFWIALYTGLAQVLSLFTISYVVRNLGEETAGYIGLIDSTILIVATIISFGIQLSVNRNVATQLSWRSTYTLAQSARLSLGILIVVIGSLSFFFSWDVTKWIYLVAPLIALNGDYSLYGHGKPIAAARLSLIRVALPNLAVLTGSYFIGPQAIYLYVLFAGIGILNSGLWASKINQVPYIFPPSRKFYKIYFKYARVGLFQLSYAILVTGILLVTKGFYSLAVIGLVFGILKYFEVFKGVLRIIVQAFFRELKKPGTNLRIDKAGILIGGGMLIPAIMFPHVTLDFLYDDVYKDIELILPLFGIAMFLASFKSSADMRVLMQKKDNVNLYTYLIALVTTIGISVGISYSDYPVYGIPSGLIAGEFILLTGLGYHINKWTFFKERLWFLVKLMPIILVALIIRWWFGEQSIGLVVSLGLYSVTTFFFYRKLLFDSSFIIHD